MTPEEIEKEGKEALEYFKALTYDPQDASMTIEDMEKTIKFHEEELAAEDKRVEGTDEYPNYGDDFADMVHIARNLLDRYTIIVEKEEEREGLRLLHGRIEHRADSNLGMFKENTDGR